jgi:hypothetical protein
VIRPVRSGILARTVIGSSGDDATTLFLTRARVLRHPAGVWCVFRILIWRFTMTTTSNTSPEKKAYFDLHITGLGYLNRIREVQPKKGDSFWACDISALNGASDKVTYVRFDTRISGADALHLIKKCIPAVEAEAKVLIGFRLGDLWTDIFTYSKGKNAGNPGVSLKARLLYISWIKIDGKRVYTAPKATPADDAQAPEAGDLPESFEPAVEEGDYPTDQGCLGSDGDACPF